MTIKNMAAPLLDLQTDLEELEKTDGIIETLEQECQDVGQVSTYLTDVRKAIESLENCPGNVEIVTTHDVFEGEA